jgi:hypothetical protein
MHVRVGRRLCAYACVVHTPCTCALASLAAHVSVARVPCDINTSLADKEQEQGHSFCRSVLAGCAPLISHFHFRIQIRCPTLLTHGICNFVSVCVCVCVCLSVHARL